MEWTYELFGRSGVGFDGAAPLNYTTIVSWIQLTGNVVTSYEVAGLIELDMVLRNPDKKHREEEDEENDPESQPILRREPTASWPTRRVEPVLAQEDD